MNQHSLHREPRLEALECLKAWLNSVKQNGGLVAVQESVFVVGDSISRRLMLGMVDCRMFLGFQPSESEWIAPLTWSHISCLRSEGEVFLVSESTTVNGQVLPSFAIGFKTENTNRVGLLMRSRQIDLRTIAIGDHGQVSVVGASPMHVLPIVEAKDRGNGGYRLILRPTLSGIKPSA